MILMMMMIMLALIKFSSLLLLLLLLLAYSQFMAFQLNSTNQITIQSSLLTRRRSLQLSKHVEGKNYADYLLTLFEA